MAEEGWAAAARARLRLDAWIDAAGERDRLKADLAAAEQQARELDGELATANRHWQWYRQAMQKISAVLGIPDVGWPGEPSYGPERAAELFQQRLAAVEQRARDVVAAAAKEADEVEQALGKALGYPAYRDDPANFPGVTDDSVCVGDHVPGSLAAEAAYRIAALEERALELEGELATANRHWQWYRQAMQKISAVLGIPDVGWPGDPSYGPERAAELFQQRLTAAEQRARGAELQLGVIAALEGIALPPDSEMIFKDNEFKPALRFARKTLRRAQQAELRMREAEDNLAMERETLQITRRERDEFLLGLTKIHQAFGTPYYSWQRALQLVEDAIQRAREAEEACAVKDAAIRGLMKPSGATPAGWEEIREFVLTALANPGGAGWCSPEEKARLEVERDEARGQLAEELATLDAAAFGARAVADEQARLEVERDAAYCAVCRLSSNSRNPDYCYGAMTRCDMGSVTAETEGLTQKERIRLLIHKAPPCRLGARVAELEVALRAALSRGGHGAAEVVAAEGARDGTQSSGDSICSAGISEHGGPVRDAVDSSEPVGGREVAEVVEAARHWASGEHVTAEKEKRLIDAVAALDRARDGSEEVESEVTP